MNEKLRWILAAVLVVGAAFVGSYAGAGGFAARGDPEHLSFAATTFREILVEHDADFDGAVTIDGGLTDIGGASAGVADGDNDVAIAGVLEVDGELEADGAIDADAGVSVAGGALNVDDAIDQDGSSDEVQLAVTGFTTQTNDLVQIDGGLVDVGGGTYSTADGDNDVGVAGDLEINGTLRSDGGVDLNGSITSAVDQEHLFMPTVATSSFTYTAGAGGTVNLFTIADGETWLIHDIYVNVTTNFDATDNDATLQIGDDGDPNGFCDLVDAELQTSDTELTGAPTGWQCFGSSDTVGAYFTTNRAFVYDQSGSAQTIDAVIAASGDDLSAGAATVYVVYTRIQ